MSINKHLNEQLQALIISVYTIRDKKKKTPKENYPHEPIGTITSPFSDILEIEELPEFKACVSIMKNDENIKNVLEKDVGTYYQKQRIFAEIIIHDFIKQLLFESKLFNQTLFNEIYSSFEEFLYSNDMVLVDSVRLNNFHYVGEVIDLGNDITIAEDTSRKLPDKLEIEMKYRTTEGFFISTFLIERKYQSKRVVGNNTEEDMQMWQRENIQKMEIFDQVIDSFRILKSSAVFRDSKVDTYSYKYIPIRLSSPLPPYYENVISGDICILDITEVETLLNIFIYLSNETDGRFKIAIRRLSSGMERRNPEDEIIDFMIGLEALYLPDGNAELSYRVCLRVAGLLFSGDVRYQNFQFLRKMYKVRSDIVHGKKVSYTQEEINRLEELLRKSIKMWIQDKNLFSTGENGNMDSWLFTPIN